MPCAASNGAGFAARNGTATVKLITGSHSDSFDSSLKPRAQDYKEISSMDWCSTHKSVLRNDVSS